MKIEEAIQTAVAYEKKVRDVYRQAEKEARSDEARSFFRVLGDEEQEHVDYLEARLAEWRRDGRVSEARLATAVPRPEAVAEKARALAASLERGPAAPETDLLSRALEVETETSRFYARMTEELPPADRPLFERFREIEEGHLAVVQAEMSLASGFGVWFDFQEFAL